MFNFPYKKKKLGLALSGGSVRGYAHLGILKVIEEHNIKVDYIAGTSVGAILGALYAQGMSVKEIISITTKIKWRNILKLPLNISGVSSSETIEKMIKRFIKHDSFDNLAIPLVVVASDIAAAQKKIINTGSLSFAIRVSSSFPGIYSPVKLGDQLLCDGGVFCNLPVDEAKDMGADIVVGINVLPECQLPLEEYNMLDIMDRSIDLLIKQQPLSKNCNLQICPIKTQIGSLDIDKKHDLIDMGVKAANEELLPFLKHHLLI